VLYTSVLDRFAGWLVDVEVPEGLTVDTDLRWRLLHALVAHGAAGPERIEEELAADPTSTGRRQAERARSLVPTAAAKEEAWRRAVHDDTLPNAVTESIISGFAHPTQKALLAPYVERYFAEVADVWERRTSEHAQAVVIGLFPSWAVEQATVDAADAWLADESHPRRCAAWSPRAGPASSGRSGRGSSTARPPPTRSGPPRSSSPDPRTTAPRESCSRGAVRVSGCGQRRRSHRRSGFADAGSSAGR
jgi:hypothetical protein